MTMKSPGWAAVAFFAVAFFAVACFAVACFAVAFFAVAFFAGTVHLPYPLAEIRLNDRASDESSWQEARTHSPPSAEVSPATTHTGIGDEPEQARTRDRVPGEKDLGAASGQLRMLISQAHGEPDTSVLTIGVTEGRLETPSR